MIKLWRSLSFRLAMAYAGLLCLSVVILIGIYYWLAVIRPLNTIHAQVDREAQVFTQLYIVDGQKALTAALARRAQADGGRRAFHAFVGPDGTIVASNLPSWPSRAVSGWYSIEADVYREGDEDDYSALVRDRVLRNGARLIVGRDAEDVEDVDELVRHALPWMLVLTLVLGTAGGVFMSRAIGRRIDAVSNAARQVMAGNLGGRVDIAGSGDDFARLGETLNLMLGQNQRLFESVRRVSDNVAHELRTPLARLHARLEQLGDEASDPEARRAAWADALAEARRLQRIIDALLRIARIEGGGQPAAFQATDLRQLALDAEELYAPSAQIRGVDLRAELETEAQAEVDPDLIFQALSNVLDNALKHTPSGGDVTLSLLRSGDGIVLSVSDTGVGLQPGEAERIQERFFRGQGAQGLPGEGLGLSLVAAIAKMHGGTLSFSDNAPGLRVELWLPCRIR